MGIRGLFLVLLLLIFSKSFGCDCQKILTIEDSKLIFTGEVLDVQRFDEPRRVYEITFKVMSTRKGKIKGDTIIVCTPCLMVACCGIEFAIGEKYEVFTFERFERDYTNICTNTHLVE